MEKRLTYSHDEFTRYLFSRQKDALDFLQHYLPKRILSLLDLSTLKISKDTFVDPDFQRHYADILYRLQWREGVSEQKEAYVYILIEHKSYPDSWVAWQLLKYIVKIWELWLKQQREEKEKLADLKLPAVMPLVLYHGTDTWTAKKNFAALVDVPETMQGYVPDFIYELYDLDAYSDAEIVGELTLRVSLLLLKYIQRDDLDEKLEELFGLMAEMMSKSNETEMLEVLLRYLVSGAEQLERDQMMAQVNQVLKEGGRTMATIAQQFIEQGIEQGIELGEAQGAYQEALAVLKRTLPRLFDEISENLGQSLEKLSLAQLRQALDLAFDVSNLAEFETEIEQWLSEAETEDS